MAPPSDHRTAGPVIFATAIRALAEGNSRRSSGGMVDLDQDSGCDWLNRAGQYGRVVMLYLGRNLHVTACQLAELWRFVQPKERHLVTAKLFGARYGDAWVGIAFAPVWRLVRAFVLGKRDHQAANLLLDRGGAVRDEHIPLLTSDQLPEYRAALRSTYGHWVHPARQGHRGRHPKPPQVPPPDLLDAQVVNHRDKGGVTSVSTKVVFGQPDEIEARLQASPARQMMTPSFVEPENLTLRQGHRRLTRRTLAFSKERSWLEKQTWLSRADDHLVVPLTVSNSHCLNLSPPEAMDPPHPSHGGWFDRSSLDHHPTPVVARAPCFAE